MNIPKKYRRARRHCRRFVRSHPDVIGVLALTPVAAAIGLGVPGL